MVTKLETQGKQIFQWGEKFVDIATLEKAVYEAVLSLGRNIMRQCIEEADRTLARQRDRGMYRDKGYRPTTLKTVMGEVGTSAMSTCCPGPRSSPGQRYTCWTGAWALTR